MKVRLVCYEDINERILGKFARRMSEELNKLGISTDIAKTPDIHADINHHIICYDCNGPSGGSTVDTVMITHIDSLVKFSFLKNQLKKIPMGICMSRQTRDELIGEGISKERLCYINPAHDGVIKPKKIVIGITSKVHNDGRKHENTLIKISEHIDPNEFSFKIMGRGWKEIIEKMRKKGFSVDYYEDFDYNTYVELIPSLDYYLYFSHDEGSMGFVDALSAGVQTIVTPQGYHLDVVGGIDFPINEVNDIIDAFNKITSRKRDLRNLVKNWTRKDYAIKHLEIWKYLLSSNKNDFLLQNKSLYNDGLNSINGNNRTEYSYKNKQIKKIVKKSIIDSIISFPTTFKNLLYLYLPKPIKNMIVKIIKK